MPVAGRAAVIAIDGYRRFVSPYKGFRCAHHHVHGCGSCSDYGRRVFAELEVRAAWRLLRARFAECKAAAANLHAAAPPVSGGAVQGEVQEDEAAEAQKRQKSQTWDCSHPGGDCGLQHLDCSPSADAFDVCSGADACACSW